MLYLKEKTENKFVKLFSNFSRLLYTFVILIENMWCFPKMFLTYGFYFTFLSYLGRVKLFFNDNFPIKSQSVRAHVMFPLHFLVLIYASQAVFNWQFIFMTLGPKSTVTELVLFSSTRARCSIYGTSRIYSTPVQVCPRHCSTGYSAGLFPAHALVIILLIVIYTQ